MSGRMCGVEMGKLSGSSCAAGAMFLTAVVVVRTRARAACTLAAHP